MLELCEPINVWVFFQKSQIMPYIFFWKGRRIKIDSVNLVHTTRVGQGNAYHFSVSAEGNFYKLAFELNSLKWFLEAVEEDTD
jgi:hypothetical protein